MVPGRYHSGSVYPRWRGEHLEPRYTLCIATGLSPLARGTRFIVGMVAYCVRFIPAGAGNTLNVYNCFLLHFLPRNNLPTYQQQFQFIKEHSTY